MIKGEMKSKCYIFCLDFQKSVQICVAKFREINNINYPELKINNNLV